MTKTAKKKKRAHGKYDAKYDKMSISGDPYYYNYYSHQDNTFLHKKNIGKFYSPSGNISHFIWWRPFWVDNIPRLEALLNKLEIKISRLRKIKEELYKNMLSFHDPKKGENMRFFFKNKDGEIETVCFDMKDKSYRSTSDSIADICQDFYKTPKEWQYQGNKKIVSAWKKYVKACNRYWDTNKAYNKVLAALYDCLSVVMSNKANNAKDNFVNEDVKFIIKINGRSYIANFFVPSQYYKQSDVKKLTRIDNIPALEESDIYV